jgi:signal transduction histidine kinase
MTVSRPFPWLSLAALLALAAAALGGLLFGLAGQREGRVALPEAESTVEVLTDADGRLTFATARGRAPEDWKRWDGSGSITAVHGEVVWVRIVLRNSAAATRHGVLANAEPFSDRIDLWTGDDAGAWRHEQSGEWVPAAQKPMWGRDAAFFVAVPANGARTLFLRLEDKGWIWLKPVWWPEQRDFLAAQLRDMVAEGCYFGVLLALLLYNAVLWVRMRIPATGFYLSYLGTFIVFVFLSRADAGMIGLALGSPWLEASGTAALLVSAAALAEFAREFLELPGRAPRGARLARGLGWALAALAIFAAVVPVTGLKNSFFYFVLASAVAHLVVFGVAIAAWRAGAWQARYFVLAFGCLFTGLLPAVAAWLPAVSLETAGRMAMIGAALEMLLLSLAMAERFARVEREKLVAQEHAMAEAERRSQMQEAYADELEHEVRARTAELTAANADKDRMIVVLGHDLRSPLTALTLSAEQVSTHAAVAAACPEFAAETAQTGRALLLLLEDVVLWARLRAGRGKAADHRVASVVAPATELHRAGAASRGLTLAAPVESELSVHADLVLAQTLVRNLVSNAVQAAGSRVVVAVTIAPEARVRITVSDDGTGLPEEVLALLRPAKTTSANPWSARSGLGLKLCVEIAEAMGTALEVHQPAAGGTDISFTLPRAGN